MAFCTNCGSNLEEGTRFCPNCGQMVQEAVSEGSYTAPSQPEIVQAPAVEEPTQTEGSYNAGSYNAGSYNIGGDTTGSYSAGSYNAPTQSYSAPDQQSYAAPNGQGYGAAPAAAVYTPGQASANKPPRSGSKLPFIIGGAALVVLVVLGLLIFGGKKDGAASTDPNAGLYTAISAEAMGIEVPVDDLFDEGFTIELKDKGKCVINADGTKKNGKWELDGKAITIKGGGVTLKGTLENGIISIDDIMNMGVSVKFANTDVQMLDGDGMAMPVPEGQTAASGEVQEKWNGLWYGCMYIGEAKGDFSDITSNSHDVYMTVDVDAEGKGSLKVYMNDTENLFVTAECYVGDYGLLTTSGTIADDFELNVDNWKFVPVPNYTDLYVMMDRIEDGESELEYYLYVKPWGKSWEEEIESRSTMIPPSVEQYNNAIANGEDAPFGEGWNAAGGFVSPTTSVDMDSIWYGTIRYANFKGRDTEDYTDDVFAWIRSEKDTGKPFFELFTTSDFTEESMLLSMYVEMTGDGFNADIGEKDAWIIQEWLGKEDEPHFSPRLENGALVMDYTYLDSQDDYSCDITIFLRVDGTPWDAENDLLPPHYADYAAALAAKEGDAAVSEPAQETSGSGDYGKSNAQADGITDFNTLKACYKWYKSVSGYENDYYCPSYEEVYEQLGVHGRKDHEDSWRDDYHVYKWETADGKDFLLFSFKVDAQGNETFNSVSWSSPLAK